MQNADYNTLLKILPPTSPQIAPIQRSLASIKPRAEAAQKKETEEVMSKLKGLGNSLLGQCIWHLHRVHLLSSLFFRKLWLIDRQLQI